MKKVCLLVGLLFLNFLTFSQIIVVPDEDKPTIENVGEVAPMGSFIASCDRYISKSKDTSYRIGFRNAEYTTLLDIVYFEFNETDNDFLKLYNLIIDNLQKKEIKTIDIKLISGTLKLKFDKMYGIPYLQFFYISRNTNDAGYSPTITLKQCKKLFGKFNND